MLICCVLIDGISYSAFMALLGKHVICHLSTLCWGSGANFLALEEGRR